MAASGGRSGPLTLSLGARLSVLAGLLLLIAGAYLFWSPLEKRGNAGLPFECGSAARPPVDGFAITACGGINERRQLQSGALALAALTVGLGGVWAFAAPRPRDDGSPGEPGEPDAALPRQAPSTNADTAL